MASQSPTRRRGQSPPPRKNAIDPELQEHMRGFLQDESPMRFGPAVIPAEMNVRQQLRDGLRGSQLTTFVRLRTYSKMKKQWSNLTDANILRMVQFSQPNRNDQEADEMAYHLMKKCFPYQFHLTATDRQFYIQERKVVVPIPQLKLKDKHRSRVVYFRPSRYFPKKNGYHKADVLETLIYILDQWTKYDAHVYNNGSFAMSTHYALIVNLNDFGLANYSKAYWSKFMALLQGLVFPVQVRMVLWVDPPKCFDRMYSAMNRDMMISTKFRQRNFRLTQQQLGDYLESNYLDLLPQDEFPVLYPSITNQQNTLECIAKDYVLFQKYLETLAGKTSSVLPKKSKRGKARRRFSLPQKLIKAIKPRKKKKSKETGSVYEVSESSFRDISQVETDEDLNISPVLGQRQSRSGADLPPLIRRGSKSAHERTSTLDPLAPPGQPVKLRSILATRRHSQPIESDRSLNVENEMERRSSQIVSEHRRGSGIIGGQPVAHKHQRKSSLSVLEEMSEYIPKMDETKLAENPNAPETISENSPTTSSPKRLSLKALVSPFRNSKRTLGANSSGEAPSISDHSFSGPLHGNRAEREAEKVRRHSDFFSNPSNRFLLEDDEEDKDNELMDSDKIETSGRYDDSSNSDNYESFDWNAILKKVHKNNGTPVRTPPSQHCRKLEVGSRPAPPPFVEEEEPEEEVKEKGPNGGNNNNLNYFLTQVERQKEKTRRLQLQRINATSASVT